MKTRVIIELFKQTTLPALLLDEGEPEWHNDAFEALPKPLRTCLLQRAADTEKGDSFLEAGYRFELMVVKRHRLLLGTPGAAPASQPAADTESAAADDPKSFPADALTGLPGRAAFDATLDALEAQYQRTKQDLLMALLDINGLSAINQVKGIEFGDHLLQRFASELKQICRPLDRVFRFGGDEFVLLFPLKGKEPPLEDRMQRIEKRLRQEHGLEQFSIAAGMGRLSNSRGSTDDLMLLCDQRLRDAKAQRKR